MRTNYLTVTNNLKGRLISFENNYFDSGHMFSPAPLFGSVIYPGKSQMYETVKTAHAATGANVMFNFAVSGSSQKISILIENPWSGWPLVGVCYGRFSTANKANYYNIYNRVYQLAAATGYRRTVNAYNDGNCFYIENIYSKSSNLNVKHIYTIGGLTFGVEWIYEYLKAINGGSCYTTKMVVVVA